MQVKAGDNAASSPALVSTPRWDKTLTADKMGMQTTTGVMITRMADGLSQGRFSSNYEIAEKKEKIKQSGCGGGRHWIEKKSPSSTRKTGMTKMIREPTSSVSRARSPPFAAALCPGPSAGSYQAATRPNNPYKAPAMMELWICRSLLFPMVAPDPVFFFSPTAPCSERSCSLLGHGEPAPLDVAAGRCGLDYMNVTYLCILWPIHLSAHALDLVPLRCV